MLFRKNFWSIKQLCFLTLVTFIFTWLCIAEARANWFDNWFQSRLVATPDYIRGQQRGYVTFGTFSARTGVGVPDYLISINPPRFRGGCGGIDMFLGGISFANFEYLVQRLQRLIQAAPAVAFELALKILSEQLHAVGINVAKFIDVLNSMQIDECKFLHGLKLDLASFVKDPESNLEFSVTRKALRDMFGGAIDLFKGFLDREKSQNVPDSTKREEIRQQLDECSPEIRQIFNDYRSVLEYLKHRKGLNSELVDAIRGVVGDVIVVWSGDNISRVEFREGIVTYGDLISDKKAMKLVRADGRVSEKEIDLIGYVSNVLTSGYNAKLSKTNLPSQYMSLVRMTPYSVEKLVNLAVYMRDPALVYGIAPAVANGFFYAMLADVLSEAHRLIAEARKYGNTCKFATNLGFAEEIESKWVPKLRATLDDVKSFYFNSMTELKTTLEFAKLIMDLDRQFRVIISEKLGSTALRFAGR